MTYFVVYLVDVFPIDPQSTLISSAQTGFAYMIAQIVDGLSTPTVGKLSDTFNFKVGKRKFWYILGTIINLTVFTSSFQGCILCNAVGRPNSNNLRLIYFTCLLALYNVGYACIQVPHMSLLPSLTVSRLRRDKLNNLRNAATYTANLSVPLIAIFFFSVIKNPFIQFQVISYVIIILGTLASLTFIILINEPYLVKKCQLQAIYIKTILEKLKRRQEEHHFKQQQNDQYSLVIDDEQSTKQDITLHSNIDSISQNQTINIINPQQVSQQPILPIIIDDSLNNNEQIENSNSTSNKNQRKKQMSNLEIETKKQNKNDSSSDKQEKNNANSSNSRHSSLEIEEDLKSEGEQQHLKQYIRQASLQAAYSNPISPQFTGGSSIDLDSMLIESKHVPWYSWFKMKMFYQYCLAYMFSRITYIFLGGFFTYYLVRCLNFANGQIIAQTPIELALIPFILYFFSLSGSLILDKLYNLLGRKKTYALGASCLLIAAIGMILINEKHRNLIYLLSAIMGIGQSLCLNTSQALIAEVIGQNSQNCAFVYGFYGFIERSMNGIVGYLVLNSEYQKNIQTQQMFLKIVVPGIPALCGLLALVLVIFGDAKDYQTSLNKSIDQSSNQDIKALENEFVE